MKRLGLALSSVCFLACGDAAPAADTAPTEAAKVVAEARAKYAACKNLTPMQFVGGDGVIMSSCPGSGGEALGINGHHILFANFDGADIRNGDSSIDNQGLRQDTMPPMAPLPLVIKMAQYGPNVSNRDDTILKIWRQVADFYADFNVEVVLSRPLTGDYLMTLVGDLKETIGLGGSIVGISPADCHNSNEANLNYAFSASLSENPDQTAVTIAHEAGHAYGLGHVQNMADIMYPSVGTPVGFVGGYVADPGPCNEPDGFYQDSHGWLADNLGLRPTALERVGKSSPPGVAILGPKEGDTVGRDLTIAISASSQAPGGLDHVTLSLSLADGGKFRGSAPVAELRPPSSSAQVRLSVPGNYELTAVAYDQFGNLALTRSHFSVATITCAVPNDCAAGQKCMSNTCVTLPLPDAPPTGDPNGGLRAPGAACNQSSECSAGFCSMTPVGQICTDYCSGGRTCNPALDCVDGICQPPMFSQIVPKVGQIGGKCTRNEDCFSGECSPAVDLTTPRYCTRSCDPDVAWTCDSSMTCSSADTASGTRNICQNLGTGAEMAASGGCAQTGMNGGGNRGGSAGLLTLLGLIAGLLFLRRRQSMYC